MPEDGWITQEEWIESFRLADKEEWTEEDEKAVQKAANWLHQRIEEFKKDRQKEGD